MIEQLCFSITGDFVTNTARDWLYAEKRPYDKVMEFLLSCMCGTDADKTTLESLAHDVLMGKRKFIGNTRNESFCMVDDDTDIIKLYPYAFENRPVSIVYEDEEEFIDPFNIDSVMKNIRAFGDKLREKEIPVVKVLATDDYGWLSPEGKFYAVDWAKHEEWANEYCQKYKIENENFLTSSGDKLIKRGWILLHSTTQEKARINDQCLKPYTKRQKEFLYDYFMERDRTAEANELWEERRE